MALEKQCSRYLMKGLGITAYDAESDVGVVYEDIITSEYYYDSENNRHKFGKLGTVFSIRAYGYKAYIESTVNDVRAIKFDGASRICVYPKDMGYPLQISAYLGSNSSSELMPLFLDGHYLTDDSVSPDTSGMAATAPTITERLYITTTYEEHDEFTELAFWASTTPEFNDSTGFYWPMVITIVNDRLYDPKDSTHIDWILKYIEPKEYDGTDDSDDNVTTSLDPKSIIMGWLVGRRIAGQRYKHPELPDGVLISSDGYILTDCNGVYLIAAVSAEPDAPAVPDEPGEVATMYLYGIPSESGNIGLRVGDTVTYYGGAVLPTVPASEYPVAGIIRREYNSVDVTDRYFVSFFEYSHYFDKENGNVALGNVRTVREFGSEDGVPAAEVYYIEDGTSEWVKSDKKEWQIVTDDALGIADPCIWANVDLLKLDGSVYISATDPIPVGEIVDYIDDIPIYERTDA